MKAGDTGMKPEREREREQERERRQSGTDTFKLSCSKSDEKFQTTQKKSKCETLNQQQPPHHHRSPCLLFYSDLHGQ